MPITFGDRCQCARVRGLLAEEMEQRGLAPMWYIGYNWNIMYSSARVTVEEEHASMAGVHTLLYRQPERQKMSVAE